MIDIVNKYYIYQHIRLDTNQVFYIGIGKEGTDRINHKRRNSIWNNITSKAKYKKEFLFRNLSLQEADQIEKYLIRFYGKIKDNTGILANILDGGHDNKDYRKITLEEKEILRLKFLGNQFAKGVIWTEERKQKHSKNRLGKTTKKKGQMVSNETKLKQSKAHKGNLSNTGKIWINNGIKSTLISKDSELPENYNLGRINWKNLNQK